MAATATAYGLRLRRPVRVRRRLLRRRRISGGYDREPRDTGSLRLKIKPRQAQVYVDGYLVGDVDSFDGAFQKLGIESGGHRVELKADGYEPLQFDVLITAGRDGHLQG